MAWLLWTLLRCHHLIVLSRLTHGSFLIFLDQIIFKSRRCSSHRNRLFLLRKHRISFSLLHKLANTLRSCYLGVRRNLLLLSRMLHMTFLGSLFAATVRLGCSTCLLYLFLFCFVVAFLHEIVDHIIVTKAFRFSFWSPTITLARCWNGTRVLCR